MSRIRLLEDALVNQIAAGEVVERPASVVKELLENSLDAGAKAISVEITEGGREAIRVVDDGKGMDRQDAELCVRRHATSKIAAFGDLLSLSTMGFRGEALASISSVSRFRLVTRQKEAMAATEIRIEGGSAPQIREIGGPPGTSIEVSDLFFNVPARRKFLKARQTESHHIAETCLKIALAHPALRLTLTSNGRRVREYLPAENREARTRAIFADQTLRTVDAEKDGIRVFAALGPPERARMGARNLYLFVNDRPVVDRGLARAVAFAYGDSLGGGHYPSGAVFLELAPDAVDVNAHPQKTEVRFAKASVVTDTLTRLLTAGLGTRTWEGGITGSAAVATGPASRESEFWDERLAPGPTVAKPDASGAGAAEVDPWGLGDALREQSPAYAEDSKDSTEAALQLLCVLGEVWLATTGDRVVVIDPPRAAAAMALSSWNADEDVPARRLLFPERIELDDEESKRVEARRIELEQLGVECVAVGPRTYAIHSVPRLPDVLHCETSAEDVLRAALQALETGREGRTAVAAAATVDVADECAAEVVETLAAWAASDRSGFTAIWSPADLRGRIP